MWLAPVFGALAMPYGALSYLLGFSVPRLGLDLLVYAALLSIPEEALKPPPRLMGHQAEGFVKSVAQIGNRLVMAVDFSKVIGEELLHVDER